MGIVIETRNLIKEYKQGNDKIQAVNGINFCARNGESVAIIGPSGCGKSTFIKLLGLNIEPNSGEIYINEQNVNHLTESKKAGFRNKVFGYIVQDFALLEDDTVYRNIEIPLLYAKPRIARRERMHRIGEVLEKVGLDKMENKKCKELSGGQKQRVAIARALVNDAQIILADEPTGALDQDMGEKIFQLLKAITEENKTLIMVTHNLELAKKCDVVISMLDGKIEREK